MTNLKQKLNKQTKEAKMSYLTVQLPDGITVSLEKVVERLNKQPGVRPFRAERYNYNIVLNAYYGKYEDHHNHVEIELTKMVLETKGLVDQAKPHLDALRQLVMAEY